MGQIIQLFQSKITYNSLVIYKSFLESNGPEAPREIMEERVQFFLCLLKIPDIILPFWISFVPIYATKSWVIPHFSETSIDGSQVLILPNFRPNLPYFPVLALITNCSWNFQCCIWCEHVLLDLIWLKISRIFSFHPEFCDHTSLPHPDRQSLVPSTLCISGIVICRFFISPGFWNKNPASSSVSLQMPTTVDSWIYCTIRV